MDISPILIPVLGICIPIVAIVAGTVAQIANNRLKADQRMALLARGMSPQDIEAFLKGTSDMEKAPKDPLRSLANARRAAVVLVSSGLGIIAFFLVVEQVVRQREVLAGAACGLIPLFIGVGFIVDYFLQKREMSRFGLELEAESSLRR